MEKIFNAKSLDEAKRLACVFFSEHGVEEVDLKFEVIDQPVRKLFVTKGEYRIRAYSADNAEKTIGETPETHEKYNRAVSYLTRVLKEIVDENEFSIDVVEKNDSVTLNITGNKLGVIIGRHGETLESLQYLTNLSNNSSGDKFTRINVDCNGYREERVKFLEELAVSTANRVLRQCKKISLEPMNPYERRIVHSKISEIDGVCTSSAGDEPYRRVVVFVGSDYKQENKFEKKSRDLKNKNSKDKYISTSYKQSSGFSTSFERDYKRKSNNYSGNSVEKTSELYEKIEL